MRMDVSGQILFQLLSQQVLANLRSSHLSLEIEKVSAIDAGSKYQSRLA